MSAHHGLHSPINDPSDPDLSTLPFSDDPYSAGLVSIRTAPAAPPAPAQILYLTEVPGTAAINVGDIFQGQVGDCFLLSSIGEIALLRPGFISNMIHVNSNGTETVSLYEASNGRLPAYNTTSFKGVSETVTNVFPGYAVNNGATQDVVGGRKEIWPQVLEKAVATLDGGYSAIMNGGSPLVAMEELTGHATTCLNPATMTLASLLSYANAGDMIVMDTKYSGSLPNGLFNSHAYMFEGVSGSGASAMVHLGNPWGYDQPSPILFSQLSKGIAEVDIGRFA